MKLPGKGYPWKQFFMDLKNEYQKDKVNDAAGAMTYFGLLAIFPFLLFLVALAGIIIQPEQAKQLIDQLASVAPKQAVGIIEERLQAIVTGNNTGLLSVGALGAIWAASNGVVAVSRALNTAYDVEESRPFWKLRGMAILFTLGGGALAIVATLILLALPAVTNMLGEPLGTIINWLRIPAAAILVMFVWAVAYYLLPNVKQSFKFISPGAVVGVVIWLLASLGFSLYVSNFGNYDATYGSLGGVIVLLLWMWISSQVLLLGAEINALIEHRSPEGKDPGERDKGDGGEGKKGRREHRQERETGRRRPEPREERWAFSPTQRTAERPARYEQLAKRRAEIAAQSRKRGDGGRKKLGFAFWGAMIGAALFRYRRTTA